MEKILNFSLIQVSYDRNLSYFPPVVLNIGDDSFLVQTPDAHRALFFFKNKNRFGVSCLVFYCPFSSRLERSCWYFILYLSIFLKTFPLPPSRKPTKALLFFFDYVPKKVEKGKTFGRVEREKDAFIFWLVNERSPFFFWFDEREKWQQSRPWRWSSCSRLVAKFKVQLSFSSKVSFKRSGKRMNGSLRRPPAGHGGRWKVGRPVPPPTP